MVSHIYAGRQGNHSQVTMTARSVDGKVQGNSPRPAPQYPFHRVLHLMTFNMNGMFTRIKRGKKKLRKYAVLAKYLAAMSIDIACIQEHRVTSPDEESPPRKHFDRLG